MQNTNKTTTIIIVILVIISIFFGVMYVFSLVKLKNDENIITSQQANTKVLAFAELFLNKVLKGGKTVSFDDRLQLENSVRALNDKDIFDSWTKFTNAKDQNEVQQDFYNLFGLLLGKIATQ